MGSVLAGITMSVDGYVTGPDDGTGCGLGVGGERLHDRVFGGPWRYDSTERDEPPLELAQLRARRSPFATFLDYRVRA